MYAQRVPQTPHSQSPGNKPRVLDLINNTCRVKGYSPKTAETYGGWVNRFSAFHRRRPLSDMGEKEIEDFLSYLALQRNVSPATQNQAMNGLIFLYKHIIPKDIGKIDAMRSKRTARLKTVFTKAEAKAVLSNLYGEDWLRGMLLYGSGLRISECLALRVKDIDFDRGIITVREGKGSKDRLVPLPAVVAEPLKAHLAKVAEQHRRDVAEGVPVSMPGALGKKYPRAPFDWGWYYVFPARKACTDPRWAPNGPVRHSLHETVLQKSVAAAIRKAGVVKHASAHTFRHSFATHLLEDGYNIREVQELMGHTDVKTTMGYLHVMEKGLACSVKSPADRI